MAKKSKPNKTTKKAINELEEGKGKKFDSVDSFFDALRKGMLPKVNKKTKPLSTEEFAKKILGFFSEKDCKNFKPQVFYNVGGDELEFMLKADSYYGDPINNNLTLYRSQETDEIIGGCIHWISSLIKKATF